MRSPRLTQGSCLLQTLVERLGDLGDRDALLALPDLEGLAEVIEHIDGRPELSSRYARARSGWADTWAERVMDISFNPRAASSMQTEIRCSTTPRLRC
jgi:hypothetical protein